MLLGLEGDEADVGGSGGAMRSFDVAVGFRAGLDAIEEVADVRLRARGAGIGTRFHGGAKGFAIAADRLTVERVRRGSGERGVGLGDDLPTVEGDVHGAFGPAEFGEQTVAGGPRGGIDAGLQEADEGSFGVLPEDLHRIRRFAVVLDGVLSSDGGD